MVGAVRGLGVLLMAPKLLLFGVASTSPMASHALWYLRTAAGCPNRNGLAVANGVFRGLGDTATPLKWALAFTAMNAILDPLFIFPLGLGAAGAAAGTALSQTLALYPLLRALSKRTGAGSVANLLKCDRRRLMEQLGNYGKAGTLVLVRTLGKISAYSVCAREAAKLGAVSSAARAVVLRLEWRRRNCEAAAVATQTLLAREFSPKKHKFEAVASDIEARPRYWIGMLFSAGDGHLSHRHNVVAGLTTDPKVRAACLGVFL